MVPNGHQLYPPWDMRGQEVHSMVLDHSAQGGVPGYPFKEHPGGFALRQCVTAFFWNAVVVVSMRWLFRQQCLPALLLSV